VRWAFEDINFEIKKRNLGGGRLKHGYRKSLPKARS